MKRVLAFLLAVCAVALGLFSCRNAEEAYADKVILVRVSHTSGTKTVSEYDIYLENIKVGESYALPHGEANPCYTVTLTVTAVEEEGITLQFSQAMDRVREGRWECEITDFCLSEGSEERFCTPPDGGGDVFAFSIVGRDKMDVFDV